jgi:DNA-binding transcriptional LysR family regulator
MTDPSIELRSWRQFLAVAEQLHFGRAAATLHMTQPPLTLAIQQLERRLGVPLFERTRRSVTLTPAGEVLVEPVRALLRQAAALPALAHGAATGEAGRIRLGFISTVGFGPLPNWLRSFRTEHPRIVVELREATGDVQLRAFERSEIDAGFVLHAPGMAPGAAQGLNALSLGVEPLVLALPESLAWANAPRLRLPDILAQPLVIFPRAITPSLFDAVLAFYHRHGATPSIAQEAIQMQTIVNLVSAGIGIAWVPRSVMQLQRPGVVYRQVSASAAAPHAQTSLVWPLAGVEPAVLRFVEFVRSVVGQH